MYNVKHFISFASFTFFSYKAITRYTMLRVNNSRNHTS